MVNHTAVVGEVRQFYFFLFAYLYLHGYKQLYT